MLDNLEKSIAKKAKRLRTQEAITLALYHFTYGSPVYVSEVYLRKRLGLSETDSTSTRRIYQAFRRLSKRGLLTYEKVSGRWRLRLTPRGKIFADKLHAAKHIRIHRPKRWDGKWRIVIFDVQEKYKSARERFRRTLLKARLYRLQDSVWVHPYDCEELVALIRKDLRLGGSVLYIIADGIENDQRLRDHFNL